MKNLTQQQINVDEILKHPKQSFIEKVMHAALQKKIAGAVFLSSLIFKTKQVCAEGVTSGVITAPLRNDFKSVRSVIFLGAFLLGGTLLGKLFKKMSFFWFLSFLTFFTSIAFMGAVFDYISQEPETYFNCWHDETLGFISCGVTPTQTNIKYLPFFNGLSLIFCIIALLICGIPFLSFIFYKFKKINLERFNNILNVWVKALICSALTLVVFNIKKIAFTTKINCCKHPFDWLYSFFNQRVEQFNEYGTCLSAFKHHKRYPLHSKLQIVEKSN